MGHAIAVIYIYHPKNALWSLSWKQ